LRPATSRIVANTKYFFRASVSAVKRPNPELLPVIKTTFSRATLHLSCLPDSSDAGFWQTMQRGALEK
jgi:hypothetical protein